MSLWLDKSAGCVRLLTVSVALHAKNQTFELEAHNLSRLCTKDMRSCTKTKVLPYKGLDCQVSISADCSGQKRALLLWL